MADEVGDLGAPPDDPEERHVTAVASALRKGVRDLLLRRRLGQIARAAMGDAPGDARGDTADPEEPSELP